jgi:hypothetical protein
MVTDSELAAMLDLQWQPLAPLVPNNLAWAEEGDPGQA